MDTRFVMTTTAKHAGKTLYEFLSEQFPFFEITDWACALAGNNVLIDDQLTTGNPKLTADLTITFTLLNYQEDAVNTHWQLVWQNEQLMAINKPTLLPVQRTTRNILNTLTSLVRRELQLPEAQPLHRLDLETAGLILFAKTKSDTLKWQPKLKTLLERKKYHAIVWGQPNWETKAFTCQLSKRADSEIRCQMYASESSTEGQTSTTNFKVIQTNGQFSIIECDLITGRKHQIRAQLAYLGHPIVGDKIYAHDGQFYLTRLRDALTEQDHAMLKAPHHLLVACEVELNLVSQPSQLVRLSHSDYPDAWQRFLELEF